MKRIVIVFSILVFWGSLCDGQSWVWGAEAKYQCCNGNNGASADSKGNVYLTGDFEDTISFGSISLTESLPSVYLAKYDSNGNILWASQSTTPSPNCGASAYSIACDGSDNTYVCGYFQTGTLILGADTLYNSSVYGDIFLMRSTPNGNVIWAKQSTTIPSSSSGGRAISLACDDSGHIYTTGSFLGSVTFGSTTTLTGPSIFLVKYDTLGNVIWSRQATNHNQRLINSNSVAVDHFGNTYITGYFSDTVYFGSTLLKSNSKYGDLFLTKYSPSGNVLWAIQSNTKTDTDYTHGASVICDTKGDVYVTGMYNGQSTIGSDTFRTSYYKTEAFLTKYDSMGNFLWAESSECNYGAQGYSLAISNNQLFLSASAGYTKTAAIGFCGDSLNLNNSLDPAIILKLDTGGKALCGSIIRTGGTFQNNVVCSTNGKYVYLGGNQMDSIAFYKDTLRLTGRLGSAPFVARWNPCGSITGIDQINSVESKIQVFPNPNSGIFTIALGHPADNAGEKTRAEIYNVMGQRVKSEELRAKSEEIDLSNQPSGIYFYRVIDTRGGLLGEGKLIIQK